MKAIFCLLVILMPTYVLAQSPSPFSYITLQDNQVVFEATYDMSGVDSTTLKKRLTHHIPTIQAFKDYNINGDVITGMIDKGKVDYKKYGGRFATAAMYLNDPFTANISVIWKDGKYKVKATNIIFHDQLAGEVYATNLLTKGLNSRRWVTGKTAVQSGLYIDKYLYDLFIVNIKDSEW